jgi:OmpA-OmpF porin, OOP family
MPAIKNRILAKIKGGADSTPNLVATEAEAHKTENNKPIKIFFKPNKNYPAKIRLAYDHHPLFFIILNMNYKLSINWLLIFVLMGSATPLFSQTQWTYDFNKGLLPIESGGTALKPLGKPGKFIKEVVPGSGTNGVPEIIRTVYKFENNTGLQFNNALANGFLSKSFTIEIYFKLDTLGSWKRVLDFKNRKSDYGGYIYDGKLNFYDYAIGEKAPIRAGQYMHYVLSRDFDTRMIKMYINGQSKLEFKDPGVEGLLDQDQVLNFFQDDLVANHEAGPGSVALIRLYDRVMNPVFIRRSYQTISSISKPAEETEEKTEEQQTLTQEVAPKSNERLVKVVGKVYDGVTLKPAQADVLVRKASNDSLVVQTKTENGTYTLHLQPEQSYRISVQSLGFKPRTIPIKTKNYSQDLKDLVRLTRENYEQPLTDVLFPQGKEELDEVAKAALDSMAAYFDKRKDLRIILKGHTDNLGDFAKNLDLSGQRVATVKNYLSGKGISADRIQGSGYGSARPNQFKQSEEQRRRNRRVEIWAEPVKR